VLTATLLALAAAALHAAWNLIIKTSAERDVAAWGQFVAGGLLFAPVLLFTGMPDGRSWPFLLTSAVVHVLYVYALVAAYHHGDFSLAYPLARGGGALVAALLAAATLGDELSAGAWAALAIVAVGLVVVTLLLYAGAYVAFRQAHAETWDRDKRTYVIYPESYGRPLYYLWRPLSYLDTALTGMEHHIGPHR